jgi:hypothetical protein
MVLSRTSPKASQAISHRVQSDVSMQGIGLLSVGWRTLIALKAASRGSLPSRPGGFHPEPLTDPDLILSHHPARATA